MLNLKPTDDNHDEWEKKQEHSFFISSFYAHGWSQSDVMTDHWFLNPNLLS